jgi:DNA-binding transcriptional LysR family regulator
MLAETYVSYGCHLAFNRWLEDGFAQYGITLRTTIEVSALPALIEVVRLGAGFGLIDSVALTANAARRMVVRPFAPELKLRSRVVRRPGRPMSRHAERFLEIYRDVVSTTR